MSAIKDAVTADSAGARPLNAGGKSKSSAQDIVSVSQIKAGIEAVMVNYAQTPKSMMPNLEEWAAIACLTGDVVANEDVYGVHIQNFIQNICHFIVGKIEVDRPDDAVTIEQLCRDLQV